ncbi:MAG: fibronectin type III domain-containing protein [Candidatus Falkowbacteria bacterium]
MAEKIKAILKDERKVSKALFIAILVFAMVVIFDLPALFTAYATQNSENGWGYGSPVGYAWGYGYWSEVTPTLALTYNSCAADCQIARNTAITITATFSSSPATQPDISIDLPGTTYDTAYTAMSGSGAVRTYSYTTASVSATSTATVSIQTAGGAAHTPTPSNSTLSITVPGGESGGATVTDTTAPTISSVVATPKATEATITWTTNEASVTWIDYGTTTTYGKQTLTSAFVTAHSVTLTGLTAGTTYHYKLSAKDVSSNLNVGSDATFKTLTVAEEVKKAEDAKKAEEAKKAEVVKEEVKKEETKAITPVTTVVEPQKPAKQDVAKEKDGLIFYIKTTKALPTKSADWKVVHFVAYGTSNTVKLAAAERKDMLTDYKAIYGKVPATTGDWSNVDSMATGVKPATRSLVAEKAAFKDFIKVYKRVPNFKVAGDNMGLQYIAYKLRPAVKDAAKEKAATATFKAIYKVTPKTSAQMAVVRAIAYSGAKR